MSGGQSKGVHGGDWDDERVAALRQFWAEGRSCAQIAKALACGISRNAVIGKAKRLGLEGRAKPSTPRNPLGPQNVSAFKARIERQEKVKAALAAGAPLPPVPYAKPVAVVSLKPRPWITRGARECAWPIDGADGATLSCCNCTEPGDRYCVGHLAVMYQPAKPRPIKAPRETLARMRA